MTKQQYEQYLDAVDVVCMECCMDTEDGSICDSCPVRITCDNLKNQYKDERPLDPLFTNTVTMKSFDYGYAWENRYNIPVNSGDLLLVDRRRKFQIVDIVMPIEYERNNRCPWYKLKPVEDTLEDMRREHDEVARKNYGMTVGKYPDFTIDVESNWFFARDVRW